MVQGKNKFALWLLPETKMLVEENYRADNCASQSEYIEKAIRFYTGYLHTKNAADFLPHVLADVLEARLDMFAKRIGKLLFKLLVENNITNHIIAADTDIDLDTYRQLRGRSIREVSETNGEITFKDDLLFQKSV